MTKQEFADWIRERLEAGETGLDTHLVETYRDITYSSWADDRHLFSDIDICKALLAGFMAGWGSGNFGLGVFNAVSKLPPLLYPDPPEPKLPQLVEEVLRSGIKHRCLMKRDSYGAYFKVYDCDFDELKRELVKALEDGE